MKRIVVVVPHSHTWFWTQVCLTCLRRFPPRASGYECLVVVVDNSPWSPAIRGVTDTSLGQFLPHWIDVVVVPNWKTNKFHASALDCVVEDFEFDYLMALETDVMVLRPDWLQWFVDHMRPTDFAVGAWHHEQFVNPSCTLYRGDVLRGMLQWCRRQAPQDELRWGQGFTLTAPLDNNLPLAENPARVLEDMRGWIGGPFAEKRGWPEGTVLVEQPSGQLKGPGWYEPGQQLYHWAVDHDHTYTCCPSETTHVDGTPVQTLYDSSGGHPTLQMEAGELLDTNAVAAHLWGGTRALDVIKHPVTCQFVLKNTPRWLAREARFWREVVPQSIQEETLGLIRRYGWHCTSQGGADTTDRDREAVEYVRRCYAEGGVTW